MLDNNLAIVLTILLSAVIIVIVVFLMTRCMKTYTQAMRQAKLANRAYVAERIAAETAERDAANSSVV